MSFLDLFLLFDFMAQSETYGKSWAWFVLIAFAMPDAIDFLSIHKALFKLWSLSIILRSMSSDFDFIVKSPGSLVPVS